MSEKRKVLFDTRPQHPRAVLGYRENLHRIWGCAGKAATAVGLLTLIAFPKIVERLTDGDMNVLCCGVGLGLGTDR